MPLELAASSSVEQVVVRVAAARPLILRVVQA
jgi:hypothetical protein